MFTPQDPRTFPSKFLQSAIVGTAKVGSRITYFTPIPVGVRIRNKLDVGDHPWIVGKAIVGGIDTIRGNPTIFRYRPGIGQEQLPYYQPANPQTPTQMNWRFIFAEAIAAWKALSEQEKKTWNTKAAKRSTRGTYLFRSRYLDARSNIGGLWKVGTTRIGGLDYLS